MSSTSTDTFWLSLLALIGIAVGVFLFFRGFRLLQYKRRILNTPSSKIRSASMGLVEVSGIPSGSKTIAAAITASPCYYYRARAWQWIESDKGGGSWRHVVEEALSVPFFLEDGTGRVLVNPQGAALDVHCSFKDEFGTAYVMQSGSPVPESIRKFIATRGLMGGDKVRLEEYIIKPGFPLFVFGTLGDNTMMQSWTAQPHLAGKKVSLGLSLGDSISLKFTEGAPVSSLATKVLAGLLQNRAGWNTRVSTYVSGSDGGPTSMPEDLLKELHQAGLNLPHSGSAGSGKMTVSRRTIGDSLVRFNSAQVKIAPDPAIAADTAEKPVGPEPNQKPEDFDLHAPVAISKGERGDPFTISSQSQREVVQSLGWKAIGFIWGGPAFALVCLYCLFVFWGRM